MVKRIDLAVDRHQAVSFVGAVRTKRDVILLWMNAIKAFLANQPASDAQCAAKLSIVVMSMSRLFCDLSAGRKIFSISFPFNTRTDNNNLGFFSREGIHIDSRVSSQIISLIEVGILDCQDFSQFIDPILEVSDFDSSIWTLLRELMLAEDAYVRYDWDEERAEGHRHPTHHLDFYYSSGCSFKVGLSKQINHADLIEILNIEIDCHYLNSPPTIKSINRLK